MSRIGRKPVPVPAGVSVAVADDTVTTQGAKGKLSWALPPGITAEWLAGSREVVVRRGDDTKRAKSFHGLARSLVANMVKGCADGYSRALELHGVGYSVKVEGREVVLQVGLAVPVKVAIPDSIQVEVTQPTMRPSSTTGNILKWWCRT